MPGQIKEPCQNYGPVQNFREGKILVPSFDQTGTDI